MLRVLEPTIEAIAVQIALFATAPIVVRLSLGFFHTLLAKQARESQPGFLRHIASDR